MLTLTRKPGERIQVGPTVEVVVKEIRFGAVRLGVEAPPSTTILRGELADVPEMVAAGERLRELSSSEAMARMASIRERRPHLSFLELVDAVVEEVTKPPTRRGAPVPAAVPALPEASVGR